MRVNKCALIELRRNRRACNSTGRAEGRTKDDLADIARRMQKERAQGPLFQYSLHGYDQKDIFRPRSQTVS